MGTHFADLGAGGGVPGAELTVGGARCKAGLTLGEAQAEHFGILKGLHGVLEATGQGVEEGDLAVRTTAEHVLSLAVDQQVVHTVDVGEGLPVEHEDVILALDFPAADETVVAATVEELIVHIKGQGVDRAVVGREGQLKLGCQGIPYLDEAVIAGSGDKRTVIAYGDVVHTGQAGLHLEDHLEAVGVPDTHAAILAGAVKDAVHRVHTQGVDGGEVGINRALELRGSSGRTADQHDQA